LSLSKLLVVGLGNPGKKYEKTRHNVGFMAVERVASRYGVGFTSWDAASEYASHAIDSASLFFLKPLTYMNRSGEAVGPFARFYKIPPKNILVVHDDLDLPFGRMKFARGGGSGGHNGIRSIISSLGDKGFPRLKIGIGRPKGPIPVDKYVLSRFDSVEEKALDNLLDTAVDGIVCFIDEGIDSAMNNFNGVVVNS